MRGRLWAVDADNRGKPSAEAGVGRQIRSPDAGEGFKQGKEGASKRVEKRLK